MFSLNSARDKAKKARSSMELTDARNAIGVMSIDTGLWPNGCPVGDVITVTGNEIELDKPEAGILSVPPQGPTISGCDWTAEAVGGWGGPYVNSSMIDPWGNAYWFDNDYYSRQDCPTPDANPSAPAIAAVVSMGPNGTGGPDASDYDCDDVYVQI